MTPLATFRLTILGCASLATLSACNSSTSGGAASASSAAPSTAARPAESAASAANVNSASVDLKNAAGQTVGQARLVQQGDAVVIDVSAAGLTPGKHGVHIHTIGQCAAPDFSSAGGHWNPTAKKHGLENPEGHHGGDMPNMDVGADGSGLLHTTLASATLSGGANPILDADGAALVIHAGHDDMKSDPAGNSGGRIACGVITAQ